MVNTTGDQESNERVGPATNMVLMEGGVTTAAGNSALETAIRTNRPMTPY